MNWRSKNSCWRMMACIVVAAISATAECIGRHSSSHHHHHHHRQHQRQRLLFVPIWSSSTASRKRARWTSNTAGILEARRASNSNMKPQHPSVWSPAGRSTKESSSSFSATQLYAVRPQDNLVAGMSEISFACSIGVLWSEYCILLTGCGPVHFSDTLERICYQGDIASAGIALFLRIVTGGASLEDTANAYFSNALDDSTLIQVRIAEWSSGLAVVGAFVALGYQTYVRGAAMEGLTGIDVSMCRAILTL